MGYNIWVGSYGNRIDILGKMVWSLFSTKVLQITILDQRRIQKFFGHTFTYTTSFLGETVTKLAAL